MSCGPRGPGCVPRTATAMGSVSVSKAPISSFPNTMADQLTRAHPAQDSRAVAPWEAPARSGRPRHTAGGHRQRGAQRGGSRPALHASSHCWLPAASPPPPRKALTGTEPLAVPAGATMVTKHAVQRGRRI